MTQARRRRPEPSRWRPIAVTVGFLAVATMMIWSVYSLAISPVEPVYHYVYAKTPESLPVAEYIEEPARGRRYEQVFSQAEVFKFHPGESGLTLYRTTARDWTNLFTLYDNLTHPRWRLPYRKPVAVAPSAAASPAAP